MLKTPPVLRFGRGKKNTRLRQGKMQLAFIPERKPLGLYLPGPYIFESFFQTPGRLLG